MLPYILKASYYPTCSYICHYLHLLIIKVNDKQNLALNRKLGDANSEPSFLESRCKCKMHIAPGFWKVQIPAHSILVSLFIKGSPSTKVLTTFQYYS